MGAVGPAAFAQRANEVLLAPASDPRLRMRCDVGAVKGAERRLQRSASGVGLCVFLFLGVAAEAARGLREIESALGVALLRARGEGGAKKQKPRRSGAQDAPQAATVSRGSCRGSLRRPCRRRRFAP